MKAVQGVRVLYGAICLTGVRVGRARRDYSRGDEAGGEVAARSRTPLRDARVKCRHALHPQLGRETRVGGRIPSFSRRLASNRQHLMPCSICKELFRGKKAKHLCMGKHQDRGYVLPVDAKGFKRRIHTVAHRFQTNVDGVPLYDGPALVCLCKRCLDMMQRRREWRTYRSYNALWKHVVSQDAKRDMKMSQSTRRDEETKQPLLNWWVDMPEFQLQVCACVSSYDCRH